MLIVSDMPFSLPRFAEDTIRNVKRIVKEGGAEANWKVDAALSTQVKAIIDAQIPADGALGLPQSVNAFEVSKCRVDEENAKRILMMPWHCRSWCFLSC